MHEPITLRGTHSSLYAAICLSLFACSQDLALPPFETPEGGAGGTPATGGTPGSIGGRPIAGSSGSGGAFSRAGSGSISGGSGGVSSDGAASGGSTSGDSASGGTASGGESSASGGMGGEPDGGSDGGAGSTTAAGGSHAGSSAAGGAGGAGGSSGGQTGGSGQGGESGMGGDSGAPGTPPIWFSEYVEGSGHLKALEIYNPTLASTAGCAIGLYHNGNLEPTIVIRANPEPQPIPVAVVCSPQLAAALPDVCHATANLNFNGDDAIAILCDGELVDVIGQIGVDPGSYWGGAAVRTADRTLRRSCAVTSGDANGNDEFEPAAEWQAFPTDTFDGLGVHDCK